MQTNSYFLKTGRFFTTAGLLFIIAYVSAQSPGWLWSASGATASGTGIKTDGHGNTYVAGVFAYNAVFGWDTVYNQTTDGNNDVFIARYDNLGDAIWVKAAGSQGTDSCSGIGIDASGNEYMAGFFSGDSMYFGGYGLASASTGIQSFFIARYDANGNFIWAKTAGGSASINVNAIATDASGNSYVTGQYAGGSVIFGASTLVNSDSDFAVGTFLVKYDNGGNVIWAKNDVPGNGLSTDGAHVYVTGGFTDSAITFGSTTLVNSGTCTSGCSPNYFAVKYDAAGNVIWAKSAANAAGSTSAGNAICTDNSGKVYITGAFSSSITFGHDSLNDPGIFTVKLDSSGNVLWLQGAGATSTGTAIAADASGNSYVCGNFDSSQIQIGPYVLFLSFGATSDIFTVKYDASGNVLWVKAAQGQGSPGDYGGDYIQGITLDAQGEAWVTGTYTFASGMVFDEFRVPNNSYDNTGANIFVAKLAKDASSYSCPLAYITTSDTVLCAQYPFQLNLSYVSGNIQWQQATVFPNFTNVAGEDSITFSPQNINQTTYFRAYINNGTCVDTTTTIRVAIEPAPQAIFTYTISGLQVSFTGDSSISATDYTWSFGDGFFDYAADPVHTYSTSTQYEDVCLTVQNAQCSSPQVCEYINLSNCPAGVVAIDTPGICQGDTATLTVTGSIGTIQWQNSDGFGGYANIPGANSPTLYIVPTPYTYYRVYTDSGSCSDTSISQLQQVTPGLAADFTWSVAPDLQVQFQATLNGGQATSYNWNFGDGGTDSGLSVTHNYTQVGYDTVCLNIGNYYTQCPNLDVCHVVHATHCPAGNIIGSGVICEGTGDILALLGSVGSIQWQSSTTGSNFTNVTGATQNELAISPAVTTYYRAYVDSSGCTDTSQAWIEAVSPTPAAVGFTETSVGFVFTFQPDTVIDSLSYTWSFGDGGSAYTANATYGYSTPGTTYQVCLTINNSYYCASQPVCSNITTPNCSAGTVYGDTSGTCAGNSPYLSLSYYYGNIQWQWADSGGAFTDIPGATYDYLYSATINQTTYFRAIVDTGTCHDTSVTIRIPVLPTPSAGFTYTHTGLQVDFTPLAETGVSYYDWSFGDGNYGYTSNPSHTYTSTTSAYNVCLDLSGVNGCYNYNCQDIYLSDCPAGTVIVDSPGICQNGTGVLRVIGAVGIIQWQAGQGTGTYLSIPGANSDSLVVNYSNFDYYRVYVDSGTCTDTSTGQYQNFFQDLIGYITYTVYPPYDVYFSENITQGYPNDYLWSFGDGTTSTDFAPFHSYTQQGRYTVCLHMDNEGGCGSFDTCIEINVNNCPAGMPESYSGSYYCAGGAPIELDDYTYQAASIQWQQSINGGPFTNVTDGDTLSILVAPVDTTYYRVVVDSGSCRDTSALLAIYVAPSPTANFTYVVNGGQVAFNSDSSIGAYYYLWVFSDGSNDYTQNPVHTFPDLGQSYEVCLEVTSLAGCNSTDTCVIIYLPYCSAGVISAEKPALCTGELTTLADNGSYGTLQWQMASVPGAFSNVAGANGDSLQVNPSQTTYYRIISDSTLCKDTSAVFTEIVTGPAQAIFTYTQNGPDVTFNSSTSINTTNWLWTFGDGSTNSSSNPQHTYTAGGSDSVCLVASNAADCPSSESCEQVLACLAGTVLTDTNGICAGSTASLSVAGSFGNIQWQQSATAGNYSNVAGATSVSLIASPTQSTYYRVYVDTGSCSDTSLAAVETVLPLPQASFTTTHTGLSVTFTSAAGSGIVSYSWNFGDGTTSNSANPTHAYASKGTDTVCLQVTDSANCQSEVTCQVISVAPNGIEKVLGDDDWNLYPNPAKDEFTISSSAAMSDAWIEIYDVTGALIYNSRIENSSGGFSRQIHLDVASGIYLVRLRDGETQLTRKLVIDKQ